MPVESVIARLEEMASSLPSNDGVGCFTRLYLDVTRSVQRELAESTFADPQFLVQLDVGFAGLYLDAVSASTRDPRSIPRAWAPLFEARRRRGIAPLQFAFAGMNAHINRDLPVALVACCRELGIEPADTTPQHRDFERVNDLLARVESSVKQRYLGGTLRALDRVLHRVDRIDDVVAMWDVRRAREAAWTNGLALWALRDEPTLSARYVAVLDRTVGLAGRGLLQPADTWLQRLARAIR
jgi:hypothetical protein